MGMMDAYAALDEMRSKQRVDWGQTRTELTRDVVDEENAFAEKANKASSHKGWGNILGTLGGGLLAAATGGLGMPLVMGLAGGLGSLAGQKAFTMNDKLGAGKFNISADQDYKQGFNDRILMDSAKSGVTTALIGAGLNEAGVSDWEGLMQHLGFSQPEITIPSWFRG